MTDHDELDQRLQRYFALEAPAPAPAHLERAVRRAVADVHQDRVLGLGTIVRRWLPPAVAGAAVALLAVAVLPRLLGQTGVGPGSPTPVPSVLVSPSPAASPSPPPTPAPTPSGVPVGASYQTTKLLFPIALSAPQGWLVTFENPHLLMVSPPNAGVLVENTGDVFFDGVGFYVDPLPGPPDGAPVPVAGVGKGAKALAQWLASRPQLVTSTPEETTVGGRPAWMLDMRLSSSVGALCGVPCVGLINSADNDAYFAYGLWGPGSSRAYFVDVAPDRILMVSIDDVDGRGVEALRAAGADLVESIRFTSP